MSVNKKDLRKSRDFVGGIWIDIEAKSEICSFITAAVTLESKLSTIPNNIKPDAAAAAAIKGVDLVAGAEEVSPNSAMVTASNCLSDAKEDGTNVPPLNEEGNEVLDHKNINYDKVVDETEVRINGENEPPAKADSEQDNDENSRIIESTEPLGENCQNVQVAAENRYLVVGVVDF